MRRSWTLPLLTLTLFFSLLTLPMADCLASHKTNRTEQENLVKSRFQTVVFVELDHKDYVAVAAALVATMGAGAPAVLGAIASELASRVGADLAKELLYRLIVDGGASLPGGDLEVGRQIWSRSECAWGLCFPLPASNAFYVAWGRRPGAQAIQNCSVSRHNEVNTARSASSGPSVGCQRGHVVESQILSSRVFCDPDLGERHCVKRYESTARVVCEEVNCQ